MFDINTERTAECIKSLVDNNRCISCDKLNTPCVRYPCGHATCAECVSLFESCLLCITPPPKITHYRDEPLSRRVENASQLVLAYEQLIGEEVDRRVSIVKQQKLEKLLFPECIQASHKYFNKRKSTASVSKGKENIKLNILLPGEEISNKSLKMENKDSYVQQWLNNVQSPANSKTQRKPFEDLVVNTFNQNTSTISRQIRKRKHVKKISTNDENVVPVVSKRNKIKEESSFKTELKQKERFIGSNLKKYEAEKSGIGLEDNVIEILDSQEVTDKDKLACEAVIEADLNNHDVCMNLVNDSSYIDKTLPKVCMSPNKGAKSNKVPFYRKSLLYKTYQSEGHQSCCINDQKNTNLNNISITIENKSFLTTINISSSPENDMGTENVNSNNLESKDSVTGNVNATISKEAPQGAGTPNLKDCSNVNKNIPETESNKRNDNLRKGVTISDSDSESINSFVDNDKEVVVEDPRSCNDMDFAVLSELQLNQSENRMRHARRENSPLSTDSSDKENYDPNRMKRMKYDKKCYQKK